jgi:peptidoglycan/xylan/chitin deacetylase (PgdA/CDA1 family)
MTWDHVREMAASPLISFGAHTIDHVSLTKVNEDEMRRQIDESVATLVRELGHPCRLFSYPEGQERDFDKRVIDWLKWRGFDHAPTAIDGTNTLARTDPFRIRRTMVGFEGRPYPFGPIQ